MSIDQIICIFCKTIRFKPCKVLCEVCNLLTLCIFVSSRLSSTETHVYPWVFCPSTETVLTDVMTEESRMVSVVIIYLPSLCAQMQMFLFEPSSKLHLVFQSMPSLWDKVQLMLVSSAVVHGACEHLADDCGFPLVYARFPPTIMLAAGYQ